MKSIGLSAAMTEPRGELRRPNRVLNYMSFTFSFYPKCLPKQDTNETSVDIHEELKQKSALLGCLLKTSCRHMWSFFTREKTGNISSTFFRETG